MSKVTDTWDPLAGPARHPILFEGPAVDFFEGALLGNGGLGAVVTTRPDAIVIHFGHNNVWDIRIAEDHADEIGTFQEVFVRVRSIPPDIGSLENDPWYRDYSSKMVQNYNQIYPRPFPCGSLVLGFDRRRVEVLGHRIDITTGECRVTFLVDGERADLILFTDMREDRLWFQLTGQSDEPLPSFFTRLRLLPDPETPPEFPLFAVSATEDSLAFQQVMPKDRDNPRSTHAHDRIFSLSVRTTTTLGNWQTHHAARADDGIEQLIGGIVVDDATRAGRAALHKRLNPTDHFIGCVQLREGLRSGAAEVDISPPESTLDAYEASRRVAQSLWAAYWSRSGVVLGDSLLEQTWYWNLYFFNCAVREGVTCPGLFANWSFRKIGTAWHGDYHMNYNTQQPFWLCFSSNHVEKHLPYVDMVDHLMPLSQKWAAEYYGLSGAYFPHSAYPVEMNIMPYPVPTWGWEICETPWTVQSLWWHYLYTGDIDFLRDRAFTPIMAAVRFLCDYMTRPEAHGEAWQDDNYHIFPTVPPELYGLMPGFDKNHDCLVDLTLTRFIFRAFLEACEILHVDEASLIQTVEDILAHFPAYPTAESTRGTVLVSVSGEDADVVYNTPNSLMPVFPGEHFGLHATPEMMDILHATYANHMNEGGNDLVFLNLQAVRIGALDLERFKRQVRYCTMPNGTCADKVLQSGGRYSDLTPYDFMTRMGIWFENFALPVVINECLMQSYTGTIQLFPNWPEDVSATFHSLRAVGGFLLSAAIQYGAVEWIKVKCECDGLLQIELPWDGSTSLKLGESTRIINNRHLTLEMKVGDQLEIYCNG